MPGYPGLRLKTVVGDAEVLSVAGATDRPLVIRLLSRAG
jgi:hypothetical protein